MPKLFKITNSKDINFNDKKIKNIDFLYELKGESYKIRDTEHFKTFICASGSCDLHIEKGGIVENIMECPREEMVRYGALVGAKREGNVVRATGLVEKPKLEEVPSNYASMGPYIIPNEVLDVLPEVSKGSNGEINLTDALNLAAIRGMPIYGVLGKGLRFDCGTNFDLQKANIKLSLMNSGELRAYTRNLLDTMDI